MGHDMWHIVRSLAVLLAISSGLTACEIKHETPANSDVQGGSLSEAVGTDGAFFVQNFVGSCAANVPTFGKVEAAATTLKWKQITDPTALEMIGPQEPGATWKAWLVKENSEAVMISTGQREMDGKTFHFCVVIGELDAVSATKEKLADVLSAKNPARSSASGQTYTVYNIMPDGFPASLTLIDAEALDMNVLNATLLIEQ